MIVQDLDETTKALMSHAEKMGLHVVDAHIRKEADVLVDATAPEDIVKLAKEWGATGIVLDARVVSREHLVLETSKFMKVEATQLIAAAASIDGEMFARKNWTHAGWFVAGTVFVVKIETKALADARIGLRRMAENLGKASSELFAAFKRDPEAAKAELLKFYQGAAETYASRNGGDFDTVDKIIEDFFSGRGVLGVSFNSPALNPAIRSFLSDWRTSLYQIIRAEHDQALAKKQERDLYPKALAALRAAKQAGQLGAVNLNTVRSYLKANNFNLIEHLVYKLRDEL